MRSFRYRVFHQREAGVDYVRTGLSDAAVKDLLEDLKNKEPAGTIVFAGDEWWRISPSGWVGMYQHETKGLYGKAVIGERKAGIDHSI